MARPRLPFARPCLHRCLPIVHANAAHLTVALLVLLLSVTLPPAPAHAAPQLWLPTPPGERWKIIQGYACGTHNGWDRYSLDLARVEGTTYGAPIRAAADGRIWAWVPKSGTLILAHGDGFYTMYTHMGRAISTDRGRAVVRGEVIGEAGDRGAPGIPHLHFTAFTGEGIGARSRSSVPLSFAEGYNLPEIKGCNQHGGSILVAGGQAPQVSFSPSSEVGHWLSGELEISFTGTAVRGFSVAWDHEPGGDTPTITGNAGTAELASAGEGLHTLFVRAWGSDGPQVLATYGPIGYDHTPPDAPARLSDAGPASGNGPRTLRWEAATDAGSGIAGYRIYLGPDEAGVSDWFVTAPEVAVPIQSRAVLRAQAIDRAGNAGKWTTLAVIKP